MGEAIGIALEQLERLLPERYRVRIVACFAFLGLCLWMYVSVHLFAKQTDITSLRTEFGTQITASVKPLSDGLETQRKIQNLRYLEELDSQILQAAARCSESKSVEAKGLYQSNLSQLLRRYQDIYGATYPQQVSCK